MSTITFISVDPIELPAAAGTAFYTTPSTPTTSKLKGAVMRFTNTDTVAHTVTVHAIPSGGTAANSNMVVNAKSIGPNDFIDIEIPVLEAGGEIEAFADATTSVTAHLLSGHLVQ